MGLIERQFKAESEDDYYTYIQNTLLFNRIIVSSINNQAMIAIMDMYVDKIAMSSYINYKMTPHIKHYSANHLNKSIYNALQAGDEEEARRLAKGAYVYARSRLFENGRF